MSWSKWSVAAAVAVLVLGCGSSSSSGGAGGGGVGGGAGAGGGGTSGSRASLGCADGSLDSSVTRVELEHDGEMRSYEIHVPPSYDGAEPLPVVLNFHGFTNDGVRHQEDTNMNETADEKEFVAVYPNGLFDSWNAGVCCGVAAREGVDDVGFTRAIIEDLAGRGCIDEARIYAAGMSNGGFFSHRLGCEAADVIAAIAPVAGVLASDADCSPARPIPIMHLHGTEDPLVPYDGEGGLTESPSVDESIEGWLTRNGCTGEPEVTYQNGAATCETVSDCEGDASVTLCRIEGAGHCWPGRPCRMIGDLGEPTTDIDANEAMWGLFSTVKLP